MPLDETKQILPQHFKDHANVRPVRTPVLEMIEERDDVGSSRMGHGWRQNRVRVGWRRYDGWRGGGDETLEEFDFV
jgi:hypothetical protein